MLANMLKSVFLVSAAKRLTDHLRCLLGARVVAVDLIEYRYKSEENRFILSVIDHLTRFLILIPSRSKEAAVVFCHLIDRVFSAIGPLETLHSVQGKEFQNQLVKELQSVFDYKKTRTAVYRP